MPKLTRSGILQYGVAVTSVLVATLARGWIDPPLGDHLPFVTYFVAVLFTVSYAGLAPSLVAMLLGFLAADYFFVPPRGSFRIETFQHQLGLALYLFVGLTGILFSGALQAARRRQEASSLETARSQRWLEVTLSSIGDAVIATDVQGQVTFLNPVAQELTGWKHEQARHQTLEAIFQVVHEQSRRPVENPVQRVLQERNIIDLANHAVLISRDGAARPIDYNAAPIQDEQGEIVGVVLTFRDVTERRRAEETQRRLAAIVESSDDAIVGKALDGTITSWNAGAERLYGYTADEMLGKPFSLLVPSDRTEEVHQNALRLYRGERLDHFETVRRCKDGRLIDVSVSYSPIRDGEGRLIGTAVITRDISERKRAEEQLRQSERELADFFDNATIGLHWVGSDGIILRANQAELDLLGYSRDEYVGRHIAEFHADDEAICDILRRLQAGEQLREYPARMRCKDGSIRDVLIDSSVLWEDGKFVHTRCFTWDVTDRKRTEEALRESEARFRAAVDQAAVGVTLVGQENQTLFVNRGLCEMLGYDEAELLAGRFLDVTHPHDLHLDLAQMPQLISGELHSCRYEKRYLHKNGSIVWGDVSISAVRNEQGEMRYAVQVVVDITERKRAHQALQEGEERLRLALDAGRMGVWDWNLQTDEIKWSDNLEPIHGLAPGTFGGTLEAFEQLIHPEDRELVQQAIVRALEDRSSYDTEFRIVWQDGSVRWMAGKGKVFTEDDQPFRMLGVGMDITERKRAEQNSQFLADASAALAAVVDYERTLDKVAHLAVPFFADWCVVDMVEADGRLRRLAIVYADPAKGQLADELHRCFPPDVEAPYGPSHVLRTGQPEWVEELTDEILRASARDEEHLQWLRKCKIHSYISVPLIARAKTLGAITFVTSESKRRYESGDLALAQDLAHRAAVAVENALLYGELKQADRRKDEFLATLAHELRNPLAPIRTGLEVMRMANDDPQTMNEIQCTMERQVQQLITLVDDLLDVSRITRGKFQLRKCPVALAEVVQSAVEAVRPSIDEAQHELTVTLPESSYCLNADPHRLAQVISNLLSNAVKYTPEGGHIWLTAERQGSDIIVTVKDTGIGIPADKLESVFEMFAQIDRPIEKGYTGLGIGLTLVKSLVEMHGGRIEVHSEGPNRGSEFSFRLPILVGSAALEAVPATARVPAAGPLRRRVLIVDDNQAAAEMLAIVVKMLGHEIRIAGDGQQAIQVAAEFQPDVVLMDLGMPKMNGYEAARRIREQDWGEQITLVALTGWGQAEDRRRTREAGFDHHLVKPAEPADLQRLLAEARQKSASQKSSA